MKARFRIISTEWVETLWAPFRRRYIRRINCTAVHVHVRARLPGRVKCVIPGELKHRAVGPETRSLYLRES